MEVKNYGELNGSNNMRIVFSIKTRGDLSRIPENTNLLGFLENTMVFEKTNAGKTPEPFQTEGNGNKFLVLNGKKFRLIHDKSITHNTLDNTTTTTPKEPRKILPKIVNSGKCVSTSSDKVLFMKPFQLSSDSVVNPVVPIVNVDQKSDLNSKNKPNTFKVAKIHGIYSTQTKTSPEVLDDSKKSVTFITSILKNRLETKQGGLLKVIKNVNKIDSHVIPLISDNIPNSSLKNDNDVDMKVLTNAKLANSSNVHAEKLCSKCKVIQIENGDLVSSGTNTEIIESVDKGIQTDKPTDPWDDILNEEEADDVIIGDNVNMGNGPKAIHTVNNEQAKIQFYNDLKNCLRWDSGNLLIHKAVVQKNPLLVKSQCVVLKARNIGVNIPNAANFTPLQLAIIHSVYTEIVETLLEYNADMSRLDSEGNNVLHLAVQKNRIDLVEIFLDNKASCNLNIDEYNHDGLTPLMCCALHKDRIDIAQRLLEHGVQVNLRDRKSGRTAIFHAAEKHNTSLVSLLLDYYADTKIRNFFGTSVHDAMFELDDMPKEIKYPILGRDLRVHQKRKMSLQQQQEMLKRKKLEMVPTFQKMASKVSFVVGSVEN